MKVYVGNLPFSVDKTKLEDLFKSFGDIEEASVITNRFSGRSKGFGFVTFKNDSDAKKAIEDMNDKDVEGRPLKVNEAKPFDPNAPRPPRRGGFGNGGRNGGRGGFREHRHENRHGNGHRGEDDESNAREETAAEAD